MNNSDNTKYLNRLQKIAIGIALFGFLIVILFFALLFTTKTTSGKELNLAITDSIGNFVGGMVGSLWTLTGVLLYYVALRFQKEEIAIAIQQRDALQKTYDNQLLQIEVDRFRNEFFDFFKNFQEVRNNFISPTRAENQNSIPARSVAKLTSQLNQLIANDQIGFSDRFINAIEPIEKYKLINYCEAFCLMLEHIMHPPPNVSWGLVTLTRELNHLSRYEKIMLASLSDVEVASLLLYGLRNNDQNRLRNYFKSSNVWKSKTKEVFPPKSVECEVQELLNAEKDTK